MTTSQQLAGLVWMATLLVLLTLTFQGMSLRGLHQELDSLKESQLEFISNLELCDDDEAGSCIIYIPTQEKFYDTESHID